MEGLNLIVVFNERCDRILMCKRRKDPYKGLFNFIGGKIEAGEDGLDAAYRELYEETGIRRQDIGLIHFMDFTYYCEDLLLEVYAGRLNRAVCAAGEENELLWQSAEDNFFDSGRYAGDGDIGHIIAVIKNSNLFS